MPCRNTKCRPSLIGRRPVNPGNCVTRGYNRPPPMTFSAGTKLGVYEIVGPLGKGGRARCIALGIPGSSARKRQPQDSMRSEVAAGLEVGARGALELALLFIKLCPTVWAGAFNFLEIDVTCAGRHVACRPVFPCRNIPPGGQESWRRRRGGPQTW